MKKKINEPLQIDKIIMQITPENKLNLAKIEVFETIDSTNSYLLAQAKKGAPAGQVCLAEHQTQGRGRRQREWFSPEGMNIYCSLLWRFATMEEREGLSIAMGVVVKNTLKRIGLSDIQLKWPNDVLWRNRKLAGILLESNDKTGVVIGVGINLFLPPSANPDWVGLSEMTDREIERNKIAGFLIDELLMQLPIYQQKGLSGFIENWRQSDILFGKKIDVQTPTKIFSGVMHGVNEKGELILEDGSGNLHPFCYGEVSVRLNDKD